MDKRYEIEFAWEYNKVCGRILCRERKARKISRDALAAGILSKSALNDIETGKARWTKLTGDTMLLRMGIDPDYFEEAVSTEEMDRWRLREDICMLVPLRAGAAREKMREYRQKYGKREPLEEQFLIKTEVLLMLWNRREAEGKAATECGRILELALDAVACTVPGSWKEGLDSLWLAPAELGAILLAAAALAACGRRNEAWELQQAVWDYPKAHQWKEKVMMLIQPQAAILGMELAIWRNDGKSAFALGKEALELLRRNCCHCYALPLLERLEQIPIQDNFWCGKEERSYLKEAAGFRDTFRQVYQWHHYPEYRLWQGVFTDNTREVGIVLKMLRHFEGKPRGKAVYDGEEMVVTERQLAKIEKGEHKPSDVNYVRLLKQYGKNEGWEAAMLETDSAQLLEVRQRISTMLGFRQWEEAEGEIEKLRRKVNPDYPRVRQELLFWEALYRWRGNCDLERSLALALEALHCTVPDFEGRDMKWWVFQREEIMIASHIADVYRKLGEMEESKKWHEAVVFSLKEQVGRSGIVHKGYDILMEGYDNLLGDTQRYKDAVKINEEAILNCLKWPRIRYIAEDFYRIAWNSYEIANEKAQEKEVCRQRWRKAFQICESLADFIYDSQFKVFLESRRKKFLCQQEVCPNLIAD